MAYIPNFPAPERAGGEYTGNPVTAVLGGPTGIQPQGANNPAGQIPGIPIMSIRADTLAMLSGPQPVGGSVSGSIPGT
jgi:hypothetical protein